MIRNTNFKKFAILMSLIVSLMAFIIVPVIAEETPVTGVSDGTVSVEDIVVTENNEYADYDAAVEYLDEYTTNKAEDPDFDANVEVALDTVRGEVPFYASFWALIPPIIAIGLALITKEVYSSLFIGIVAGGLLAANFNITHTVDNIIEGGLIEAVSGTAGIFVFLVILGIMVALINKSGGSAAFGRWAEKNIKSRVGASIATFVLGVLIFIDDYFNCLTVGSIMKPVTDSNKISRSKFAYLIDATAAPVCMIAPISSWAAAVASYAEEGQGLKLFIEAIPYNFYSLLTFVFIIGITLMKFDYGPMKKHEENALNGDLFTSGQNNAESAEMEKGNEKGIVLDIIFPIVALIVFCIIALVYNGNGNTFEGLNFIEAFSNTDATVGLPWGALIALIISIIYFAIRKVVSFKESMDSIPTGFKAMVSAILILTMATALKNMTGLLGAKVYVAMLMNGAAGLQQFLPAIIFIVACILAFATGTSWGTFGILIPIVTAIFPDNYSLMIIGISACLAGAVCGDHCSPISDTTIMSSAGAQCDHLNHVSTQLPYAITVAAVSFVNFLIAPFIMNAWISLAIAVVMMVAVLFIIKKITVKKA
ncbi:MAG: Na+/H+ antiporter NhaC family protein [Acutalibacteraceae bacterium]|nr:Na+/H+ antiporter NhaC family protein [Acutalibacteraceae bacterium]